jgi:hypothetical protein
MKRTELLEVATGNATHLKVELYYSLGGMNYFTGANEARGLYLSVSPVTRTVYEFGGASESYVGFSGIKQHVLSMGKKNQKTFDGFKIDEALRTRLINHVCEKNNITLKELVA